MRNWEQACSGADPTECVEYSNELLRDLENAAGHNHIALIPALLHLGASYLALGSHDAAQEAYRRATVVMELNVGPDHPALALPFIGLGNAYVADGDPDRAEAAYRRAIHLLTQPDQATDPRLLRAALVALASLKGQERNWDEVAELLEAALQIDIKDPGPVPYVNLRTVAMAHSLRGDLPASIRRGEQFLTLAESSSSAENFVTLQVMVGDAYQQLGKSDHAATLLRAAVRRAQEQLPSTSPTLATALNGLAEVLRKQGSYEEALDLHRRALEVRAAQLGAAHFETASSLNNLALTLAESGRFDEAQEAYGRALAARKKAHRTKSLEYGVTLKGLAVLRDEQGRYQQAEALYMEAIGILAAADGAERELAQAFSDYGTFLIKAARYGEAEARLRDSIRRFAALDEFGRSGHANALNSIAVLYQETARFADATRAFTNAQTIAETTEDDLLTALVLNNRGTLLLELGQLPEAERSLTDALQTRSRVVGSDHPGNAVFLENLATLRLEQARGDEALHLLNEAKALADPNNGIAEVRLKVPLAQALRAAGDLPASVSALQSALREARGILGSRHPTIAILLNNLGELYLYLGRLSEADSALEEARQVLEDALGPQHPRVATTLVNLAGVSRRRGSLSTARDLLEKAQEIFLKAFGERHPSVASVLLNLGGVYEDMAKFEAAVAAYTHALEIEQQLFGERHPGLGVYLTNLAGLQARLGEYDAALAGNKRAIELLEAGYGESHPDVGAVLNNLGATYLKLGDHKSAGPVLERALSISESSFGPDATEVADVLINLATLREELGDFDSSSAALQRAQTIIETQLGNSHPNVAIVLDNRGVLESKRANYPLARTSYESALSIRRDTLGPTHPLCGNTLNNLASLAAALGDSPTAEALYLESAALYRRSLGEKHPKLAVPIEGLAVTYQAMGQPQKAEEFQGKALRISEEALPANHPDLATRLSNLAALLALHRKPAEATPLAERSLEIRLAIFGSEHPEVAEARGKLGALHLKAGAYDEAATDLHEALGVYQAAYGDKHPETAGVLVNLGALYQEQGDSKRAEDAYLKALSAFSASVGASHPDVARTRETVAALYLQTGRYSEAVQQLRLAAEIDNAQLFRILAVSSESRRLAYAATLLPSTWLILSLPELLQAAVPPPPPALLEEAETLAMRTILTRKMRGLDVGVDIWSLWRRRAEAPVLADLTDLRTLYARLASLALGDQNLGSKRLIDDLGTRAEAVEQRLASIGAGVLSELKAVDPANLTGYLAEGEALVEFARYRLYSAQEREFGAPRYAALLITADGDVDWLPLGPAEAIDPIIKKLRANDSMSTASRQPFLTAARQLEQLTMMPVRKRALGVQRWIVAPDGPLAVVPFSALAMEDGRYLGASYDVALVSSGRDLFPRPVAPDLKEPLVVGAPTFGAADAPNPPETLETRPVGATARGQPLWFAPIPGTEKEVKDIGRLLRVSPYVGSRASEETLKAAGSPEILHIATHGFFLPPMPEAVQSLTRSSSPVLPVVENPLLWSGLALAGANQRITRGAQDGILTALEMAGMDLGGTKLVVLSACDTGLGALHSAGGLLGLRRALMLAGTTSQVLSLWKVDDRATARFMTTFYERLTLGEAPSVALRKTQKTFIDSDDYGHPYYWAAFVISGQQAEFLLQSSR